MTEPITSGTTQPPAATTPADGQGTAAATTTPAASNTNTEQTTTQAPTTTPPATPPKPSPEEVQKRIDRMYARLQEERKQRMLAEEQLRSKQPQPTVTEDNDGQEAPAAKPLTEADVEAVLARTERQKALTMSEMGVFARHPDALNEDGSFNMADPFVQKYMEVARTNPELAMMSNGPELAEAMADKMLGTDFKKGRRTEAIRTTQANDAFTTSSTIAPPPPGSTTTLSPVEQKIARRMGITDKEYSDQKANNRVAQKSWEVKAR